MTDSWKKKRKLIQQRGLTIYDQLEPDSKCRYELDELEAALSATLVGRDVADIKVRTRSKLVKGWACEALGYSTPKSFKRVIPRIQGQDLEVICLGTTNFQLWNAVIHPLRRFAFAIVDPTGNRIVRVKAITGLELEALDKTGKLTRKFQARFVPPTSSLLLSSHQDGTTIQQLIAAARSSSRSRASSLLGIKELAAKLEAMVGTKFTDIGATQDRNRGAVLHRLVADALGLSAHADNGQFPDIPEQLLEVKLQTAQTIDLGLLEPDAHIDLAVTAHPSVRIPVREVRYAVFGGKISGGTVEITSLDLLTGADFYARFPRFQGRGVNSKLQIRLPAEFFG